MTKKQQAEQDKAREDIKQHFLKNLKSYYDAFNAGDFNKALKHADEIEIIGLGLASEAWNRGMDKVMSK